MEEWKEVEGYTSYDVSNTGLVRERMKGRIMPQTVNGGFWCTNLYSDHGISTLCKVHRLVAIAFIPNPDNLHNVDHKEDRLNNDVNNLQWRLRKVKIVKEKKQEETIVHLGEVLSMKEFVILCGVARNTVRARLKSGWSSVECALGIKSFTGQGYEDGFNWYPTKDAYDKVMSAKRASEYLKYKEKVEKERQEGIKQRKQNRADYKKWGVGNFVNYPIPGIVDRQQLKVYRVWAGMISRCYSKKNQSYSRYGGRGVYVCKEWHEFQIFAAWYYEQYKEDDWHIDKDILSEGEVCYSPETCVFIPAVLNTLLSSMQENMERDLPMGVNRSKTPNTYSCQYMLEGKKHHKQFKNIYEAALHYKENKESEIKRLTEEYKDRLPEEVYQFFINYTIDIREEFKTPL